MGRFAQSHANLASQLTAVSEERNLFRQMSQGPHLQNKSEQDSSDEIRHSGVDEFGAVNNSKLLISEYEEQTVIEIDPESGTRFVYHASKNREVEF